MKYKFSDEALVSMVGDVGRCLETDFTLNLYNKLRKTYHSTIPFKKVDLSNKELEYLWKVCGKGDGTITGHGKVAGEELSKYLGKALPHIKR